MSSRMFSYFFAFFISFFLLTTTTHAADKYWVGATASWDGTAGTKWSLTSGGAGGQAIPTSIDNCFFDASSTGPGSMGNETTTFGTKTKLALIKYQKANNITPAVGYFGPVTRGELIKNK